MARRKKKKEKEAERKKSDQKYGNKAKKKCKLSANQSSSQNKKKQTMHNFVGRKAAKVDASAERGQASRFTPRAGVGSWKWF